jgi:hypothetical protein
MKESGLDENIELLMANAIPTSETSSHSSAEEKKSDDYAIEITPPTPTPNGNGNVHFDVGDASKGSVVIFRDQSEYAIDKVQMISKSKNIEIEDEPCPRNSLTILFSNSLLSQLSAYQKQHMLFKEESRSFFSLLEKELDKINKFYQKTEKECALRHTKLVKQIRIYNYNLKKKNILSKLGKHSTSKQMIMLGFQEHYRALVLLQNYRVLNFTGFTKILKKYIKCSSNSNGLKQEILNIIQDEPFYASPMLNTLIEETEDLVTEHLHNGNRKQAMDSLRLPNEHHQEAINQQVAFRCGIWLGCSVILTIIATYTYLTEYALLPEPSYSQFTFFVFRVLLFPILLMNFIAVNLRIWDAARINYVFIFELDPRKHMSKHKFFEISLILYLLWISFLQFYMWTVVNDSRWHFNNRPWIYPLILTGLFLFVLLFPHPAFFNGHARMWILKKIFNCIIAPFVQVRFADFWIADQLTSMSEFLFEVQFVFCILPSDFISPLKTFCNQTQNIGVPILNVWPLISRVLQCFRRYRDDGDRNHLWNAGKYGSSIFVMLWAFFQKSVIGTYLPAADKAAIVIFVLANIFSTFYKCYWDVIKDWGLFRFSKDVKYKGLRKDIVFNPLLYYLAIILNVFLRFVWVLLFAVRLKSKLRLDMQYFLFLVAFAEIFRRFIWNIFRLENEHLNNCGKFRVVLDIPLPFQAPQEEQKNGMLKKKESFFARWGIFRDSPLNRSSSTNTAISLKDMKLLPPSVNSVEPKRAKPLDTSETSSPKIGKSKSDFFLARVRKSPSMPLINKKS